ncbi:glycosyltransferase family 4 protein [Agrococcus beijingensis]|uniref:glycosyltransferase family 4 protein n=1 Tax=Agrococcus beijingensis TaxID=3068634 RepID=UPI002741A042|nr:glycosyltransferase family 1 protein [Agrococcus sp. REN33]
MPRPVTVAFDDQIFVAQPRGGVSKTFVEIARLLPEFDVQPIFLSRSTRNEHLAESGFVPAAPPRGRIAARAAWVGWRLIGHPREQAARLPRTDVLHHTFTHPSYLGPVAAPRVVSIYDFMPERFPELFPLGNPHFAKRRFAMRSDAILTNSQATTDDLARFYGAELLDRTTVAHLGVSDAFLSAPSAPMDLPAKYLLFVGVRRGYKEFSRFLAAAAPLLDEDASLSLVIVGGGELSDDERAELAGHGIGHRAVHLRPADSEMRTVYARASAFVFPSLYEGFGLPTIESLAAGTPVVLADAGCSREVGGPLAHLFTPGDAESMRAALRQALTEPAQRRAAEEGPAWAGRFTWRETARKHAEVYRHLVADAAGRR